VVLVLFGEDNWGKLIDISENGMSFEFGQLPPLHQRINFTFEAMGPIPLPAGRKIFSGSFRVAGDVLWAREFERTAGVKFADLDEEHREQIRLWLSGDTSISAITPSDNTKPEEQAPQPEPFGGLPSSSQTTGEANGGASELELEWAESSEEFVAESRPLAPDSDQELKFGALQESLDLSAEDESENSEPYETQIVAHQTQDPALNWKATEIDPERLPYPEPDQQENGEPAPSLNPRRARLGFITVSVCVAAVAALAGARMSMSLRAARSESVAESLGPSADGSKPLSALSRSTVKNPFLVEVLDANNRRWLLSFINNGSEGASDQAASKFPRPSFPLASATKAARQEQRAAPERRRASPQFVLGASSVGRTRANDLAAKPPSVTAPALPGEMPAVLATPISSIATNRSAPAPVTESPVVGGDVQVARLIKSAPPTYPALAKSNRIQGDVTMDALVDPAGNVTDVKVISGPPPLQGAAMAALRQWKYEPARLDGRPVAFHLNVTVKFHIN